MTYYKVVVIFIFCFGVSIYFLYTGRVTADRLVFLDVEQGDAILVQSQDGGRMLIDCGPDSGVVFPLSAYMPFTEDIDVLLISHPDSDHVMGCIEVIRQFRVKQIVALAEEDDLPAYTIFLREAAMQGIEVLRPIAGDVIDLPGMSVQVLWPFSHAAVFDENSNDASYVVRVQMEHASVLLTGDVSTVVEEKLVNTYGANLHATYLKLGHHGSDTSSGDLFLRAVSPREAFNSSGTHNRFRHPHAEVLKRLRMFGIPLRDTQDYGSIEVDL